MHIHWQVGTKVGMHGRIHWWVAGFGATVQAQILRCRGLSSGPAQARIYMGVAETTGRGRIWCH